MCVFNFIHIHTKIYAYKRVFLCTVSVRWSHNCLKSKNMWSHADIHILTHTNTMCAKKYDVFAQLGSLNRRAFCMGWLDFNKLISLVIISHLHERSPINVSSWIIAVWNNSTQHPVLLGVCVYGCVKHLMLYREQPQHMCDLYIPTNGTRAQFAIARVKHTWVYESGCIFEPVRASQTNRAYTYILYMPYTYYTHILPVKLATIWLCLWLVFVCVVHIRTQSGFHTYML